MPRRYSEASLCDHLFRTLCASLAPGQLVPEYKPARLRFVSRAGEGECTREGSLSYRLPSGLSLIHKSDILISLPTNVYVSMELKWLSAVPDQFKARSYDITHLKRSPGREVHGIMIYVHAPRAGISIDRAKAICFPFNHFVGLRARDMPSADFWAPVVSVIRSIQSYLTVCSYRGPGPASPICIRFW